MRRQAWPRLLATAALVLTATACGDDAPPRGPQDGETNSKPPPEVVRGNPEAPLATLLENMSRGSSSALRSCVLDIRFGTSKHVVALQHPNLMRRETQSGDTVRIEKLYDGKHWVSERALRNGTRTYEALDGAKARGFERLRLLLGSVLGWDLATDGDLKATNVATWYRVTAGPVIHREFDTAGKLSVLAIDGARWKVTGWHEERGAYLPELVDEDGRALSFERVSLGSRFLESYFEPTAGADDAKGGIIRPETNGEPQFNFEKPLLEHAAATQYIEAEVPPNWEGRLRVVADLGMGLGQLGQRPDGLPAYVGDKVRVHFAPAAPDAVARAPKGYSIQKRAAGNVLVIHRRIAFARAAKELEPILLAHAKANKYFPAGPLRLLPHELPRPDPKDQPAEGATVLIRAELPIR